MQVSERDKKLLLFLLAVAVFCIPFFFVIEPLMEKNAALAESVAAAQAENVRLLSLDEQKEYFLDEAQKMAVTREDILKRFPEDLPQEEALLFLRDTEEEIPISLYQSVYTQETPLGMTGENTAQADAEPETQSASQAETDAVQEQLAQIDEAAGFAGTEAAGSYQDIVLSENMTGLVASYQINFAGEYGNWKKFLEYILTCQNRTVITSMNATYQEDGNQITGSFEMSRYAVSGAGREPVSVQERSTVYGTTNIFRQAAGRGSDAVVDEPDFFLMLSPADADVAAKIFGQSGDAAQESYLTNDSNQESEITIVFSGENGSYTASCSLGKVTYEDGGVSFTKDGNVNLEILSTERLSDKDLVGGQVHIINNMDVTLGVTVSGDDTEKPRVNIRTREGAILMK